MTVQQLLEKYHVYCAEDISAAWQKYVNEVEDYDTWDYNAAMLEFLRYYFSTREKKERELIQEEKAVDNLVTWINVLLKRDSVPLEISAKKKSRRKAALAACDKLGWHPFMNYPTDIYISEREKGQFLCQLHSSIFYSRRAGEVAMELLDKDRFTNHFLTLGYAAKCQNLNAYYRIGRNLAGADTQRAQEILSYVQTFAFHNQSITIRKGGKNGTDVTYTLSPNMPVYWYYLGAEADGILCAYEAAVIFRKQNIHSLCAKYMYTLTTFDNDHRAEAECITLEELATQKIPESAVDRRQRNALLSRLVERYSAAPPAKLSPSALRLLAEHAYEQKKYRICQSFYQRAGITSPKDTTDSALVARMGNMLYDLGDKEAALTWLTQTYGNGLFFSALNGTAAKLGDIYLERWKKNKSAIDAQRAADYLKQSGPTPQQKAMLLQMYLEKAITLTDYLLRQYAQDSLSVLDAKTAGDLGYQLWLRNKATEDTLCVALMRRALDLDKTNGLYWNNLGRMVGYNTVYGEGFSAQNLEEAKLYFETARRCGYTWATLYLSDCYWSGKKEGFPQDFDTARELLQSLLTVENTQLRYAAYMRLANIGKLQKQSAEAVTSHLIKAHQTDPKAKAALRFRQWYGEWLSGYVVQLDRKGTLQQEMEQFFCGSADFLYAVAVQQEQAGNCQSAITLYGCSAAMGSKKALCNLYNMAKPGTDYFAKKEASV